VAAAPNCLGMCGGFAAACGLAGPGTRGSAPGRGVGAAGSARPRPAGSGVAALAAFHLGRLATYSLLGALMGTAGSFTAAAGRLAG